MRVSATDLDILSVMDSPCISGWGAKSAATRGALGGTIPSTNARDAACRGHAHGTGEGENGGKEGGPGVIAGT